VPLFAEEYARMLMAGQDATAVPDTLQGIVTARIDALDPTHKALLQDAAVLGKVFWTDALAALTGEAPPAIEERLRALERREFVRRERRSAVSGARQYVFLHALVRDAAYAQIPRADRSQRHRHAAEWIATLPSDRAEERAETLGHHLDHAVSLGEAAGLDVSDLRPAAASAWRGAGDRAWGLGMTRRAAELYRRAHVASGGGDWEAGLQFRYGQALTWAEGIGSEGERHLEDSAEKLASIGEPETAAVALTVLARARWSAGRDDEGLAARALALVADVGPTPERGRVLELVAIRRAIRGDGVAALELVEEALDIARRLGDRDAEAQALNTRGVALAASGDLVSGIASVADALAINLEHGGFDTPRAYVNLASLEGEYGDLEASRRHHREGLSAAERLGNGSFVEWIATEVALDDFEAGAWDDALDRAERLLAERAERGVSHYMDTGLMVIVATIAAARHGILRDDLVEAALAAVRTIDDPQAVLPALGAAADTYRVLGFDAEAEKLLDELVERVSTGGSYNYPGAWIVTATLAWSALREGPLPDALFGGQTTRWAEAAHLLRAGDAVAAADALAAIGATIWEAGVREHAAALLAAADPVAATAQLELALATWRTVGADARIRRLDPLRTQLRPAAS
jgi:tetratricopeptide (TPR) repeat protein